MGNNFKRILILLFVVSALLLMIGSVSANDVDLNNNLETSLDLDDGLSVDDSLISNPDNKVSNQLAISNIDDETGAANSVQEDLDSSDLNSEDVVSNNGDTTINTKDSENNIKAENELEGPNFTLIVRPLNETALVGEVVSFEIIGTNVGDTFSGIIPIHMQYDEEELHYLGYTPGANLEAPDWYDVPAHFLGPLDVENAVWDEKLFGYSCYDVQFSKGFYFNFTVNFEAKKSGTPGNYIFIDTANKPSAITTTKVFDANPNIQLVNDVLNPVSNVGDIISFEISLHNTGAPLNIDYIPINVLYSENELVFVGFTRGANGGKLSDPETIHTWCDQKVFKYECNGLFDSDEFVSFTAQFKVVGNQNLNPGIFVSVDAANNPTATATTNLNAIFTLNNTAVKEAVNIGSIASFEIFVRNVGGNFNQGIIPIDVYFNPDELEYVDFTVGVNPDMPWGDFSNNFLKPIVIDRGHLLFGYNTTTEWGSYLFDNGHCFNFTANFKTLKEGWTGTNAEINWDNEHGLHVSDGDSVYVGRDADFKLEYNPSSLIVNVNDTVSFDVIVTNNGGNYYGWLGIDIIYNSEELEYINFTPNFNPDNYKTHDENGNPTPNPIDFGNGHLYFGYGSPTFIENGHVFNFTVNFKPLKVSDEGFKFLTDASIDWWQIEHHYVNNTAYVYATDADFVIDIIALEKDILKAGDTATFEVVAHNRDGSYYGSYIGFDLFFNPEELQYTDFRINKQPDGRFRLESGGTTGQSADGLLGISILGAEDGHLHFGFTPSSRLLAAASDGGENTDCSFNFTIKYKVLGEGLLENNAELTWADSDNQKAYSSAFVAAGDVDVILTKTPLQEKVKVGDDVYFEVFLKNNGTAPIYMRNSQAGRYTALVDDWYPGELTYVDYTVNSNSSAVYVYKVSGANHIQIGEYIPKGDGYWLPGEYMNVTLHFIVTEPGIHCNHVFFENYSTFGSVITEEPNINLTKDVKNHTAELYGLVYFDIVVRNLEDSIPYFDHFHNTKDLVIHDYYPEGLVYYDYVVNDYSQEGSFKVVDEGNNNLSIIYTPDADRWYPGNYINVTVIFNATQTGKFVNHANVYWKWKDWEPEEEFDLWDDDYVIVGTPKFSLEKISNFETANVGDIVSFTLIYKNTGDITLTGVYITDNEYTNGLVYSDYSDKSLWTFDGKDTWYYNGELAPDESVTLDIFFKATSPGEKNNTAIAGHNITNETHNDTGTVLILDNETDDADDDIEDDGDDVIEEDSSVIEKSNVVKSASLPAAGNPLLVLVISLLALCLVPLRGKK